MKKFTLPILVLILALVLSACGGGPDADAPAASGEEFKVAIIMPSSITAMA